MTWSAYSSGYVDSLPYRIYSSMSGLYRGFKRKTSGSVREETGYASPQFLLVAFPPRQFPFLQFRRSGSDATISNVIATSIWDQFSMLENQPSSFSWCNFLICLRKSFDFFSDWFDKM